MKQLFLLLFGLALFVLPYCQAQPLTSEEHPVTLNTASGSINGKLLLPAHAKSCHVVVLIAGSGPTDMDGNNPMMKNNSLKFLAEGLALKGIASLRFDKRGIASSASAGKEESKLRLEDYVNDVTGWIDLLAKDKRFTGITVAGHSEGSLIGMLTCRKRPKVKGFISIAGAGSPAYDLIEKQVAAQMTPESIRKEVASINESLKNGKEVAQVPAYLQTLFRPSVQPYLISWYKYNPQTVIASLKMPILILQGKKDSPLASILLNSFRVQTFLCRVRSFVFLLLCYAGFMVKFGSYRFHYVRIACHGSVKPVESDYENSILYHDQTQEYQAIPFTSHFGRSRDTYFFLLRS